VGNFAADFTAPDNTLLSDYVAADGTTFAAHASYAGHFYILSNRATTPSGGSGALSMASWTPASADYSVTAGTYISTTQVSRSGPAFRIQPGGATFYYTRYRAGLIELMRVVNGTQSPAGTATYSIASRVGTTPQVTIEGIGGTITVTVDGVLMITATGETLIPGAGKAGMYWDNGTVGDATGQLMADLAGADLGASAVALGVPFSGSAGADLTPELVAGVAPLALELPFAAAAGADFAPALAVAPQALGIPFSSADGADFAPAFEEGTAAGAVHVPFSLPAGADYLPALAVPDVLAVPFAPAEGAEHIPAVRATVVAITVPLAGAAGADFTPGVRPSSIMLLIPFSASEGLAFAPTVLSSNRPPALQVLEFNVRLARRLEFTTRV
jgi:hypothetical protein